MVKTNHRHLVEGQDDTVPVYALSRPFSVWQRTKPGRDLATRRRLTWSARRRHRQTDHFTVSHVAVNVAWPGLKLLMAPLEAPTGIAICSCESLRTVTAAFLAVPIGQCAPDCVR